MLGFSWRQPAPKHKAPPPACPCPYLALQHALVLGLGSLQGQGHEAGAARLLVGRPGRVDHGQGAVREEVGAAAGQGV